MFILMTKQEQRVATGDSCVMKMTFLEIQINYPFTKDEPILRGNRGTLK